MEKDTLRRRDFLNYGFGLAGIIAAGKAPAAVIKSIVGARSAGIINSPESVSNPYVTDGLVAMWDGIWNAGLGVHDSNATFWKDLSGNEHDCHQNGDLSIPLIGKNCIYFDSVRRSYVFDFIPSIASTKFIGLTVEICGDFSGFMKINNPNVFSASPFNNYKGDFVSRYAASQLVISSYSTQVLTGLAFPRYGFTVVTNSSEFSVYVGGAFALSKTCSFTSNRNIQRGYFGYAVESQMENPRNAKIYGARIYSRALTSEEIAYNYAIDKERFGL